MDLVLTNPSWFKPMSDNMLAIFKKVPGMTFGQAGCKALNWRSSVERRAEVRKAREAGLIDK